MADLDAPEDQGIGKTQMHDAAIAAGLVEAPVCLPTDDELQRSEQQLRQAFRSEVKENRTVAELERTLEEGGKYDRKKFNQKMLTNKETNRSIDDDNQEEEDKEEEDDSELSEDEEEILAQLRRARLQEMKQARDQKTQAKLQVKEISAFDFESAVVLPSKQQHVLLCVYRPNSIESTLLLNALSSFAASHPSVVCLQMPHSDAIAHLPLTHCPVVMLYYQTKVKKQWSTLQPWGGKSVTGQVIEWELSVLGVVDTQLKEDPSLEWRRREQQEDETRIARAGGVKRIGKKKMDSDEEDSDY